MSSRFIVAALIALSTAVLGCGTDGAAPGDAADTAIAADSGADSDSASIDPADTTSPGDTADGSVTPDADVDALVPEDTHLDDGADLDTSPPVDTTADSLEPDTATPPDDTEETEDTSACAPGTAGAACVPCVAGEYCAGGGAGVVSCGGQSWDDDGDPSTPCVSKTPCGPGTSVADPGSAVDDRACSACAEGYTDTVNAPDCAAWVTCMPGTFIATPGTATSDRVCATCESGTTTVDMNSGVCRPECAADTTLVGGGAFVDGAGIKPDGEQQGLGDLHEIGPLCVDTTEVTVARYAACVDAGVCTPPPEGPSAEACGEEPSTCVVEALSNYSKPERSDHPVNGINLAQAETYCAWVGARLPTRWEWEWAARGGDEARWYPWPPTFQGDPFVPGAGCLRAVINTTAGLGCGAGSTASVGSRSPSGDSRDGLVDMAGNVAEWTSAEVPGYGGLIMYTKGGSFADPAGGDFTTFAVDTAFAEDHLPSIGVRCVADF